MASWTLWLTSQRVSSIEVLYKLVLLVVGRWYVGDQVVCLLLGELSTIIIIIVIILLDLHSFDTPHIPTVTFLTVLEVDSVDTYG